jgi:hypothetical protein
MELLPIFGPPIVPLDGQLQFQGGRALVENQGQQVENAIMGLYISQKYFSGGKISATFIHDLVDEFSCSELVISYNPESGSTIHVGISRDPTVLVSVRGYDGKGKWENFGTGGSRAALVPGREFHIEATIHGSSFLVKCNGVELIKCQTPFSLQKRQAGLFVISKGNVTIKNYLLDNKRPQAFVVMQFSSPYNEVYIEVIRRVCEEVGIDVYRIDESPGTGIIINDIAQAIKESSLVIADISPLNANVFYEVGYAHGINKPTILIAERGTKLPFDVSPFRTIFYDNSISGKPRLERGLKEFLVNIMSDS